MLLLRMSGPMRPGILREFLVFSGASRAENGTHQTARSDAGLRREILRLAARSSRCRCAIPASSWMTTARLRHCGYGNYAMRSAKQKNATNRRVSILRLSRNSRAISPHPQSLYFSRRRGVRRSISCTRSTSLTQSASVACNSSLSGGTMPMGQEGPSLRAATAR